MKKGLIGFVCAATLAIFAAGCAHNIDYSAKTVYTPASLEAPVVRAKVMEGVNYIQWQPVKNATKYAIWRYTDISAKKLADFNYKDTGSEVYEYFDIVSHDNLLENGVQYTYIVTAYGVQSDRSAETVETKVDFVMDADTILGDSKTEITVTANIPEMYSQVAAVKDVKTKLRNGEVLFNYTIPTEYGMKAMTLANINKPVLNFAHASTGIDDDRYAGETDFDWFSGIMTTACDYVGTTVPSIPGTYKYEIVTYWPSDSGCDNGYYLENSVTGTFNVPASSYSLPAVKAASSGKLGIKVTFKGILGAEYKLWRASVDTTGAWEFKQVTATPTKADDPANNKASYTYYDNNGLEVGKTYIYAVTGTYKGEALTYFDDGTDACWTTEEYSYTLSWDPNFAAYLDEATGKVNLAWNVEDGVEYTLTRVETYTTPEDGIDAIKAVSLDSKIISCGVCYVTDTVERLEGSGKYIYRLVGKNTAGGADVATDEITYTKKATTFKFAYSQMLDNSNNGLADALEFTLIVAKDYDISDIAFNYATAEIDNDDAHSELYDSSVDYEFTSEYKAITLTQTDKVSGVVDGVDCDIYTFVAKDLTEDDLASNIYGFAATLGSLKSVTLFTGATEDFEIGDAYEINPEFGVRETDPGVSITGTVSWNTKFSYAFTYKNPADISIHAAKISIATAYSNETDGDKITNWTTDTGFKLIDGIYTKDITVSNNKELEYFYVKVTYSNLKTETTDYVVVLNQAYDPSVTYHGIKNVGVSTIYTNVSESASDTYMYFETDGGIAVSAKASDYTVFVTPLNSSKKVNGETKRVESLYSIIDTTSHKNTMYDVNSPSFYFGRPAYSEAGKYPFFIVHVYDKDGNCYRTMVNNW